jgi:peptidoglycan-associated lipoprotein
LWNCLLSLYGLPHNDPSNYKQQVAETSFFGNEKAGIVTMATTNNKQTPMAPGQKARIEGHCDERGTTEYNLALGQRRADSTKAYLTNLGVDKALLETVSYGKEKPLCKEKNEECWAKNRRAHFEPVK